MVMLCAIRYLRHLHNLKNVKNTHRVVILLVKLMASVFPFTKRIAHSWVFSRFLNSKNETKLSHISFTSTPL